MTTPQPEPTPAAPATGGAQTPHPHAMLSNLPGPVVDPAPDSTASIMPTGAYGSFQAYPRGFGQPQPPADSPAPPPAGRVAFTSLREANVARQAAWCPDQVPDLSFRGNELGGEVGEALNVIKKLERERHGWRGSRDTVEHLAEELADVVICADLVAITAGINLDAAVRAKFNATSEKVGLPHRLDAAALAPGAGAGVAADVREAARAMAKLPANAELNIVAMPWPERTTSVVGWEFSRTDEGSGLLAQLVTLARYALASLAAAPEPPAPLRADAAEGSVPTDIALAVAFAIRRAISRHVDRHGDIADQLDAACDDAMDAALKAMADPSEAAPDRPGPAGREEVETLRAERDELADYAHKLQVALTNVAGGGSENFVGHGDGFRADIRFCVGKIQQRFTDSEERFRAQLRSCKAAEAELAALRSGRGAPGGGAAVPDDLRRLSEAATPGPWEIIDGSPQAHPCQVWHDGQNAFVCETGDMERAGTGPADAEYIVALVNWHRARLADAPGRG